MSLKLSFQGWILGGCFLVVLCTLIFVATILQNSLGSQLIETLESQVNRELALTQEVIKDRWPANPTMAQADALADQLGQRVGLRLSLITLDGKVMGDTELSLDELKVLENHANRPEVRGALHEGQNTSIRHSDTLGQDMVYAAGRLEIPGREPLVVRLSAPLTAVEKPLGDTRRLVLGAMLLGLLLSTGVAYLVARGISRPVKELTSTAASIAGGDLSRRMYRYPNNEVGELGQAFDHMADILQRQIKEVTEARDRLETVLRAMVEGVLVIDSTGHILLVNRALKSQLNLSLEPVGRRPSDAIRNPELLAALAEARQGAPLVTREIRSLGPPKRFLEASVSLLNPEDPDSGQVAVLHDMTELKRTEQVRRDFVANVSHELRTPLTAIRGSVETLLDGALDSPEDARRFAEAISRQVVRLQRLVQDLLDLAALEGGEAAAQREDLDLGPVVAGLVAMVADLAHNRKVELTTQTPDEPVILRADRRSLEQAVLNLLDNAIKYTGPEGSVTAAVEAGDQEVVIRVSDTGMGIPAEHLPRIFERFYRVDKNRSREMGGTGLGLAIVKHVAQRLDGRVEVESTPGRGTTFRLVLPSASAPIAGRVGSAT